MLECYSFKLVFLFFSVLWEKVRKFITILPNMQINVYLFTIKSTALSFKKANVIKIICYIIANNPV